MRAVLRGLAVFLLAALLWAVGGYFASAPLGMIYGWSGHPPIPGAPRWVYVSLYLVALPLLSLAVSWSVVRGLRRFARRSRGRRGTGGGSASTTSPRPSSTGSTR